MKSSRSASLLLAAALCVTLGVKAVSAREVPPADPAAPLIPAEAALAEAGFATTRDLRPFGILLHAQRGQCRMLIAAYAPHATLEEAFAAFARPVGAIAYAWQGELRPQLPRLRILFDYYARREAARAGLPLAFVPPLAVAAGEACDLGAIDWSKTGGGERPESLP